MLQVLQALHHPNVVSCKEAFVSAGKLCILMDYCSEGEYLSDDPACRPSRQRMPLCNDVQVIWPMRLKNETGQHCLKQFC